MKNLYLIIILSIFISKVYSQQIPLFRTNNTNAYLYNPAMAGSNNEAKAMLHYRKHWVDVDGSPETAVFSIDGKAKDKPIGIGFMLINDVTNIIGRTSVYGTYSYKLNLSENQKLDIGLSAGFVQNRIYYDRIRAADPAEENLLNNMESATGFDGNIGLRYVYKYLSISLCAKQLFNNNLPYLNNSDYKEMNFQLVRHFYANIEYNYSINNDFKAIPSLVLRDAQGMPLQYDFNLSGMYKNKYWLNLSYSSQFGVALGIGGKIYDNFIIGYNYDVTTGQMFGMTGNTHEIAVGYVFSKLPSVSSEYRVIKKTYNEYESINQEQSESLDKVEQENEDLAQTISKKDKIIEEQNKELRRLKQEYAENKSVMENSISSYGIGMTDINIANSGESSNLELGYYVIVGSFVQFNNAKSYQKILKEKYEVKTKMFQNKKSKYYFIYSKQSKDKKELQKEYKKLKKLKVEEAINSKLWFYKLESADEISK